MTGHAEEHVDRLAEIAVELVTRVRDETPADNGRWLADALPSSADWFSLCFVLAAAVPDDRPWLHLTAWRHSPSPQVKPARRLQPCGTPSAYARHKEHGEDPCEACDEANREYQRERKRAQRKAA